MPPDNIPPTVAIARIVYNDTAGQITLEGTAADNIAVVSVDWANAETGGSGACGWSDPDWDADIAVQAGDNTITITAWDAASNSGTAQIVVNHTACAAGGGTTVVKKVFAVFDD